MSLSNSNVTLTKVFAISSRVSYRYTSTQKIPEIFPPCMFQLSLPTMVYARYNSFAGCNNASLAQVFFVQFLRCSFLDPYTKRPSTTRFLHLFNLRDINYHTVHWPRYPY